MPLPVKGLLSRELVNVPVQLLYARNELLKKIIANAAKRKSQLHIDATGARMAVTPEAFQFGKNVFSNMHKKGGLVDQFLRSAGGVAKGVVKGHAGHVLDGMTPKAEGFKRYLELLKFDRARRMYQNAEKYMGGMHNHGPEIQQQIDDVFYPEVFKSMGTAGGTGVAGLTGLNALFGGGGQPAATKQSAAFSTATKESGAKLPSLPAVAAVPAAVTRALMASGIFGKTFQNMDQASRLVGRGMAMDKLPAEAHRMLRFPTSATMSNQVKSEKMLQAIKDHLANSSLSKQSVAKPTPLGFALPAAAIGAGAGGLYGAVMGPRKKKLRAILKGLISGGAAGGGAGLGLSLGGELGARAGYALPAEGGPSGMFKRLHRSSVGAQAGAPLGALGGGMAGMLLADRVNGMTDAAIDGDEKDAAELPTPTSRGNTEKVKMPEAKESEPDCDPEGVQMTAADHDKDVKSAASAMLAYLQQK